MKRLLIALLTVFALLQVTLLVSTAEAARPSTQPNVKQSSLRFRSTGDEVIKFVTVVNPTSSTVNFQTAMADTSNYYFHGDSTVGTCVVDSLPPNSSCTLGIGFNAASWGAAPGTYTNEMFFTFRDSSYPYTELSTDSVEVLGISVAPKQ